VNETTERQPFPAWLRELCYFGGLIVLLGGFLFNMKSDIRSQGEKQETFITSSTRAQEDVAKRLSAIEDRLPNKEADGLRYRTLEEKVDRNRNDLEFAIAKLEKWKEDVTRALIKKGVID
jgi:hypothetical protein